MDSPRPGVDKTSISVCLGLVCVAGNWLAFPNLRFLCFSFAEGRSEELVCCLVCVAFFPAANTGESGVIGCACERVERVEMGVVRVVVANCTLSVWNVWTKLAAGWVIARRVGTMG